MADYRGLGFDPVPGSASAVAAAAERCAAAAVAAELPVPRRWTGAAAEAYGARVAAVASELAAARRSLRAAAEVLDAWGTSLLGNQRRAEELDRVALRLRRELDEAADEVDRTAGLARLTPDHAERHAAATRRHDDLRGRLAEVLHEAGLLERDHHAEARRVAERLRTGQAPASAEPDAGPDVGPGAGPDAVSRAAAGAVVAAAADLSALTAELASVLLGAPRPAPGRGAAAAFAAGLG